MGAFLEPLEAWRPAGLVLDLGLPGPLDGLDVLAVVRSRPELADIPVVVLSARNERTHGMALGVEEYLVKPVSADVILRVLRGLRAPSGRDALVVEDDPVMAEFVGQLVEETGLRPKLVGTGEDALTVLQSNSLQLGLVVLDLGLPGVDGFAVLESIRARPDTRRLPVLILTGRSLSHSEKRALAERVTDVPAKADGVAIPLVEAIRRTISEERPAD